MITATGLELRAGPRLLLGDATFRIAPGDRVGLVGRNGAGKTTLTRVLSGETPAGRRRGHPVRQRRLPAAGPAHRRPRRARPRPDPVRPRPGRRASAGCARPRARWPAPTRTPTSGRCAATPRLEERVPGGRRLRRRERGRRRSRPAWGCPSGCSTSRCAPCPAVSAAGSSCPASCSPRPARRHAAARRADQPPRRRLDRLAARLPAAPTRAGWWSSATTSACSSTRSTGCSTSTPTGPSSTSTTSAGRPTCSSGRPTSGAASASGPTSRSRPSVLKAQADRMRYKATKARAAQSMDKRAAQAAVRAGRGAPHRQGRQAALPGAGAVRQDAADRRGAVEVLRLARGLHRRRPGHRPGQPGRHPRPQRRRQDHPDAAAGRRRGAGHRRGRARATA